MSGVQPKLILREKWLEAMEHNQPVQCKRQYGYYSEEKGPVCALGLAARIAGLKAIDRPVTSYLKEAYGFHDHVLGEIIMINDKGSSFKEIAAWIRENPKNTWND
jgi:hypothetical protein